MPLLLTILGARPQFIKAAALTRAIAEKVDLGWSQSIIHTGQHYDAKLSDIFFGN
jgi:UDP-GlcNAc3NAcA epimerase